VDGPDAPPPEPAITIRGLVTRIGAQVLHDGLDLDVRKGEVMGIVGGSGTGKSVLLRIILGLMMPAAGSVRLLGREVAGVPADVRRGIDNRIGVLFQDGALFSSLTVAENIEVPLHEHTRVAPALMREIARVKIELAGLPPSAANKRPSELSGGMRKRAGLARALALDPDVLFLDEPTAGLDPIGAAAFDDLVRTLQKSLGLTVVMITHDLDSLVGICDRIAVLVDRRVVVGTLDDHLGNPHPWIRDYFHGPRGRAARHQTG
jgi:phospholipid/cholesterol/gamma-HCH transport system ATP-binding protein